ncbi:MAG: HD domain-containing protein [Thermoplasmata archaeon]
MVDASYIESKFPELKEIKDGSLRKKVVEVWVDAMNRGGWKELDNIPFTLLIPEVKTSLAEHTSRVTKMAIAIGKERKDVNLDYLVAGGLLHDVAKLTEYDIKNGKVVKSEFGKLIRHPVSGLALAMKHDLPVEVCHIIGAHSEEGEKVTRIPEAIIIHHCDFVDFEIAKYKAGMK